MTQWGGGGDPPTGREPTGEFQIFVKTIAGRSVALKVTRALKVAQVKTLIYGCEGCRRTNSGSRSMATTWVLSSACLRWELIEGPR